MITSVDSRLAQQIVETVKDVCGYDINFIRPDGSVFASTNPGRIGTFHEIGKQAAFTKTTIEVTETDCFTGTLPGINLPFYHNGKILAVIGITGIPDDVRKYVYLAERITHLLIREQEVSTSRRSKADKIHFIVTTLSRQEKEDQDYLLGSLKEYAVDVNSPKRFVLIQINPRYNLVNLSLLEQKIGQLFSQTGICLDTFRYPREFLAIIEETDYIKYAFLFEGFAKKNPELLKIAIGKSSSLFRLFTSYDSAVMTVTSSPT